MGNCFPCRGECTQDKAAKVTEVMRNLKRLSISDLIDVYDREALISRRIDRYLAKEKKAFSKTVKLLLLGPAESGKTTLIKQMKIVDVSGQRSERRKWVSVFDNVNAIFFIAAIAEFDQTMIEDNETNRLLDGIKLFNEVGNNALFNKASMILFLNKKDLFEEKIKRVTLQACFPDYRYKNDYKNATAYIIHKFKKQITDQNKTVYAHLTCAKDTNQIEVLTNNITDMIISSMLQRNGVM
ncbi:CRE-GPA-3 protein [Aphelenchoides avenae]|nr:CRE-GPA-3 protein [Aphelenchus avenae]